MHTHNFARQAVIAGVLFILTAYAETHDRRGSVPIPRVVVSQEEMDQWPVDRARSGGKCWAESTWGTGPLEGPNRNLFDWNTWPCRLVFEVDAAAAKTAVVRARAEWRRSSLSIRMKGLKLVAAKTGKEIHDARLLDYGQGAVVIDFRPAAGPGEYYLYYGAFEQVCFTPSSDWAKRADRAVTSPEARPLRIEARCRADAFDDMEITAMPAEVETLLARRPDAPYLVFPEDRDRSIKLQFELPVSWAADGPKPDVHLQADRNEYRVFQLGLWACRNGLAGVEVAFSDLRPAQGAALIPSARLQCLTLESRIKSRYIAKPSGVFAVPKGEVRALWCGIDIPEGVPSGEYQGTVTIHPTGEPKLPDTVLPLQLAISNTVVPERGDHDLTRLSRLRWVESDVGLSDEVYTPYRPISVNAKNKAMSTWGHSFSLDAWGLPKGLEVNGKNVLARPVGLTAQVDGKPARWRKTACTITDSNPGYVEWKGRARAQGAQVSVSGRMEYDGCMVLDVAVASADGQAHDLTDLVLSIPWQPAYARLAAGMGYRGLRQGNRSWRSLPRGASGPPPMLWMGAVEAGLGFGTWETTAWEDAARADAAVVAEEPDSVTLRLNLGAHRIETEKPWKMTFALLPTPVKPPDPRHWQFQYMHKGGGFWPTDTDTPQSFLADKGKRLDEAKNLGVRRLNLHDWWGPMFNYAQQWEGPDNLTQLTKEAHQRGLFAKVYNSGRELSSFAPEFWFLAYEGTGGKFAAEVNPAPRLRFQDAWEQNHFPDVFQTGWPRCHRDLGNEHALPVSNHTRNGNFYLESMRYMTRFFGTDGAYWDGADGPTLGHREMAKRLWVMFRQTNPDAVIDVHHGHSLLDSPVTSFMFCFPFIDSLWHGEGFDYDRFDPWTWLVEVAAVPFNVPSEMLGGFDYPGRGMLFGIWPRYGWGGEPAYLPKLWGFFNTFQMEDATMLGWWTEPLGMGSNGITVDRPDTYVTAFRHPSNGVLLAIATWHQALAPWMEQTFDVSLLLDRKTLGLPDGELRATDILTGEEVDIAKPVLLPDMKAGRLVWVRGSK